MYTFPALQAWARAQEVRKIELVSFPRDARHKNKIAYVKRGTHVAATLVIRSTYMLAGITTVGNVLAVLSQRIIGLSFCHIVCCVTWDIPERVEKARTGV
jgi:hypothetical protein